MVRIRVPRSNQQAATEVRRGIGHIAVRLCSDAPRLSEDFSRLYPAGASYADSRIGDIDMAVRKAGRSRLGRSLYFIYGDGEEIAGPRTQRELLPFLEWGINLRVIARGTHYLQLHAASLAWRGAGVVFAGGSGCGKSTLAAGLMARGWDYLCDEFALIDPSALALRPFPKAICVKAGAFAAVERLGLTLWRGGHYIKALKGRVGYIKPLPSSLATADAPLVRYMIFPSYSPGAKPRLERLPPGRAFLELAGCIFNRNHFEDGGLPVLAEVVRQCECFRLESGDLRQTCALVESELGLSPNWSGYSRAAESPEPPTLVSADVNRRPPRGITNDYPKAKESILSDPVLIGSAASKSARLKGREAEGRTQESRQPLCESQSNLHTRRDALRLGSRLAYMVPTAMTFSAQKAFAQASSPSGVCSTGVSTGELCTTDSDCCSAECSLGVCQ